MGEPQQDTKIFRKLSDIPYYLFVFGLPALAVLLVFLALKGKISFWWAIRVGGYAAIPIVLLYYLGKERVLLGSLKRVTFRAVPTRAYLGDEINYEVAISVRRELNINMVQVILIRTDAALKKKQWPEGTKREDVFKDEQVFAQHIILKPGEEISNKGRFVIPRDAMHTFETKKYATYWKLHLKVNLRHFPDYEDEIAIKVLPAVRLAEKVAAKD